MSIRMFVPRDSAALALGADEVATALLLAAQERGLEIELVRNGSRGMFWLEPLVEVEEAGIGDSGFGIRRRRRQDGVSGGRESVLANPESRIPNPGRQAYASAPSSALE